MKIIKKLSIFFALFLCYFIIKEFMNLYIMAKEIHPYFAYTIVLIILSFTFYFALIPIIKIFKISNNLGPTKHKSQENKIISQRINRFRENKILIKHNINFAEINNTQEDYNRIIKVLKKEVALVRKRYISQLFYSTAIVQNGFIDAILILSTSINLVKEIFLIYNGRVSNKDLLVIGKQIYFSLAIGGSKGIEYTTEEIFSKLSTQSIKSIPFLDKILSSIADGFFNAAFVTRISYITENYCTKTYIESDKELYPNPGFIANSVKNITSDIFSRLRITLKKIALEKSINMVEIAINPAGYVIGKTIEKKTLQNQSLNDQQVEKKLEIARIVSHPFTYGINKLFNSLKK